MIVRVIKSYRDIVAICDSDLIGKRFEEGDFQIEVKESFFKGEETPHEKVLELLYDMSKEDATFNIIGKNSVGCALKAGIIKKEGITEVAKVPFAIVLL